MRAALAIAAKDLRQRLRDRSALILGVVAPLVLALVFSLTGGSGALHGHFAVVDEDHGQIPGLFLSGPMSDLKGRGIADVAENSSLESATSDVKAGRKDAVFVFPPGFSAAVTEGQPAELTLLVTERRTARTLLAGGVARSFISTVERTGLAVETIVKVENVASADLQRQTLLSAASQVPAPTSVVSDPVVLRQLSDKAYPFAGMAVFFVFLTVQFSFLSLHSERADGTLSRMLASPIRPRDILLGKALVGFVLGLSSVAVLVLLSILLRGASWGPPAGVVLLVVGVTTAAMGIMAAAATLAHTYEQANSIGTIVAVVLGLLGGSFFPTFLGPDFMARLSLATPHAWWIRGLGDLAPTGAGFSDALTAAGVLFAFGIATGAFALWRAQRLMSA